MIDVQFHGQIASDLREALDQSMKSVKIGLGSISFYFDCKSVDRHDESERKVLVLLEPPAVMPENYNSKRLENFDLVIILSPWRAEKMKMLHYSFQPISPPPKEFIHVERRRQAIVLVNDLKFGGVKSSLYGWRLQCIAALEKLSIPIDVFGPHWKISRILELRKRLAAMKRAIGSRDFSPIEPWRKMFFRPKSFQGHTPDKLRTMSEYKYALIIENDIDSLTEKLFDALYAGNIVFYRGPDLNGIEPLNSLCITLPSHPRLAAIRIQQVIRDSTQEYETKRVAFVQSETGMQFCSPIQVAEDITKTVVSVFGRRFEP